MRLNYYGSSNYIVRNERPIDNFPYAVQLIVTLFAARKKSQFHSNLVFIIINIIYTLECNGFYFERII